VALSTADGLDDKRGPPDAAPWAVPLSDLVVDNEIEAAVSRVIRSGWWSMGPNVEAFEQAFASYCGSKNAIAVANGTAALHLSLLAVGCTEGDEVVLPSLNFVAAANAITHTGAAPVFCDIIGPNDLSMDPRDVEAAITPSTRAIVVLHYGGTPCDIEAILDIARRHELAVVEDAAHALGATVAERMCGTFGDVGCFSFFANKNLPVGEGGMVVTDDDAVAERLRLMRSHGMTTLTWDRHRGHASSYDVVAYGFNYRLDEPRAAVGLVELRRLPDENVARARIAALYRERLAGDNSLVVPFGESRDDTTSAHHLAVVVLPEDVPRDAIRETMRERGIQTSVHYPPIHRFSVYAENGMPRPLPQTEAIAERILTLPLFAHMTDVQVDAVADALFAGLASSVPAGRVR
jgi:dTDP-4-amino-4,6-dideoxygalactose transaminase